MTTTEARLDPMTGGLIYRSVDGVEQSYALYRGAWRDYPVTREVKPVWKPKPTMVPKIRVKIGPPQPPTPPPLPIKPKRRAPLPPRTKVTTEILHPKVITEKKLKLPLVESSTTKTEPLMKFRPMSNSWYLKHNISEIREKFPREEEFQRHMGLKREAENAKRSKKRTK